MASVDIGLTTDFSGNQYGLHVPFNNRGRVRPRGYSQFGGITRQTYTNKPDESLTNENAIDYERDGKRPRKSLMRKTIDYNSPFVNMLEQRRWCRDYRDRPALQPDLCYYPQLLPPMGIPENPANAVATKFVKTATNKMRCPIYSLDWTPEGRRLITGASSGEFTLWNGLTFNFETILQAHDCAVRSMEWSHNDQWMVTGDHGGFIKYWQSNMNNVKMFKAHQEPVRSLSFGPTDLKFATCSDDGTVRIWDFYSCLEERVLRGHGSDVKCVDWHPTKSMLVSGSKDSQQPIKIWEPKTGAVLHTLHAHKSTVMNVQWNQNGNWLLTASRDHLIKLFDIRNTRREVQIFRGHRREASVVAWHPVHEGLFASGGSDGSIMFWNVGDDKEIGVVEDAHDSIIWSLAWHPIGHILCSGSNDHSCKFWTRNRPGDTMRQCVDKAPGSLPSSFVTADSSWATLAATNDVLSGSSITIPGMGMDDQVEVSNGIALTSETDIPGFEVGPVLSAEKSIKTPYAKPVPKSFQAIWNKQSNTVGVDMFPLDTTQQLMSTSGCISLAELQQQTTAVIAFGRIFPNLPGSRLCGSISLGEAAVLNVLEAEC